MGDLRRVNGEGSDFVQEFQGVITGVSSGSRFRWKFIFNYWFLCKGSGGITFASRTAWAWLMFTHPTLRIFFFLVLL